MRSFTCGCCGAGVPFSASICPHCAALLGYRPERLDIAVLAATERPHTYALEDGSVRGRCLDAAWGCNWLVAADGEEPWCRSCALTRGRPPSGDVAATAAWARTEADKRRVVHHLDAIGLPLDRRSADHPDGVVFELVHGPGGPSVTGHLDGVITVDLTDAGDGHREHLRGAVGEAARTMLGRLRHQLGHYYRPLLVADRRTRYEFRSFFGDERRDDAAVEAHGSAAPEDPAFVSGYAGAHPAEDWAETFEHYLLIRDAAETCEAVQLWGEGDHHPTGGAFTAVVRRWAEVAERLDAVAEAIGTTPPYPYVLSAEVVDKLLFVDRCVRAATRPSPPPPPVDDGGPAPDAGASAGRAVRCEAIALTGRCGNRPVAGSTWCGAHAPR